MGSLDVSPEFHSLGPACAVRSIRALSVSLLWVPGGSGDEDSTTQLKANLYTRNHNSCTRCHKNSYGLALAPSPWLKGMNKGFMPAGSGKKRKTQGLFQV